ncbi:tachykinin-like peptides receptor 86C [Tachypleus tridentatus]|uniref:tachykinin-like peptides receptor 86C n=1 Tax=Tachypleus tridentatus TaxID=6853 RepID=UPI003FD3A4E8
MEDLTLDLNITYNRCDTLNDTDFPLYNASYCENNTSESVRNTHRPFILPLWQQILWTVAFGLMVVVASGGNTIVLWVILAHRKMRTVTNYFLLNLSLADLLMATFNAIFNFVYMLNSHWPFGSVYCILNNFIANLTVCSSVFTITAMSIDRCIAIVRPLTPRMSKVKARVFITVIWLCSVAIALPTLLFSTTATYSYGKEGYRILCYLHWPDGPSGLSTADYVYNILFLSLTYAVPMISMGVAYAFMGHALWGGKTIGEATERHKTMNKSKKKVVRMLIVIVLIFAICWLPYHVFFLYTYHYPETAYTDYIQPLFLSFYWLAMSNSVYNPVIYYWANKRFKEYFQSVLCCRKNLELPTRPNALKRGEKSQYFLERICSNITTKDNRTRRKDFVHYSEKGINGHDDKIAEDVL